MCTARPNNSGESRPNQMTQVFCQKNVNPAVGPTNNSETERTSPSLPSKPTVATLRKQGKQENRKNARQEASMQSNTCIERSAAS